MLKQRTRKTRDLSTWIYSILTGFVMLIVFLLWISFEQSSDERNKRSVLYARMIEGAITRTLESVEIGLTSIADEITEGSLDSEHLNKIRDRALKILRFAPHLRQVVVVQDGKTLIDTRSRKPENINMGVLGIDWQQNHLLSLGLQIGPSMRGRFLPLSGRFPDESISRQIIPVGIQVESGTDKPFYVIATLNPGYVKRYIDELPLKSQDRVFLLNFSGNTLIQRGLYGPLKSAISLRIADLLNSGGDEQFDTFVKSSEGRHAMALRMLSKYPLVVSVNLSRSESLLIWIKEKQIVLIGLISALFVLIVAAYIVIRGQRKALQMREQVQLLSEVVEHNPTVIVITDIEGGIEYVNTAFENVTGYLRSEVIGCNPRILKSGETTDESYKLMWEHITGGGTWQGEFHNRTKSGELYWERSTIGPLVGDDGNISHFIALKEVITEQKEAEDKLRLASDVFKAAAEAIMVTDAENRIQMVNSAFERITGYSEDDALGRKPNILRSGKHNEAFYTDLYECLEVKEHWEGEIWNKRKDGSVYPQWLTISSRFDKDGGLEGYVSLFSDITKRKDDEAVIIQQANYDALTGLPNRNLFADRLNQGIRVSDRNNSMLALLFIDLDRFKYVNDTFGHFAGDLLLKQVAGRLQSCIRKSDTVSRFGGDEFGVIIQDFHNNVVIEKVSNKILAELERPFVLDEHEAFISCSIGIVLYPENGEDGEALVQHADSAMYKAKARGRNTKEYYSEALNQETLRRGVLEKEIFKALPGHQLFIEYQPIWDIQGSRIEAIEALLRWQHPQQGRISPVEFIPLAEETGCIHSIGEWVINQSCAFAKELEVQFGENAPVVSINVSSVQFHRGNVAGLLQRALEENKLDGSRVIIEITESVLLLDELAIDEQIGTIVSHGMRLAVDDFGTGFSSLSYLKKYPISRIKIDKSFIKDIALVEGDQALVSGLISLAESLQMQVVIEGVENHEQLTLLKTFGSPMIQGYLFSKPLSPEKVIKLCSE